MAKRKSRKGLKQHSWETMKSKDQFKLYHDGLRIDAFLHCTRCGRIHGITNGPRGGKKYWTWMPGGVPQRYGQGSGGMPGCSGFKSEQLLLNLDCTASK